MLTHFTLRNFKNHHALTLDGLGAVNVLVGANASGKSSVLEAAHALHQLGRVDPFNVFGHGLPRDARRVTRGAEAAFSIGAAGICPEGEWSAALTVNRPMRVDAGWSGSWRVGPKGQEMPGQYRNGRLDGPAWVADAISHGVYLRLEPSQLRERSYPEELPPRLAFNGYGLASTVSYIMRTAPDAHKELTERLRSIVPSVVGLRAQPVQVSRHQRHKVRIDDQEMPFETNDSVVGDELLFDTVDARGIPGGMQSEGTLLALGLLTAMVLDDGPHLVLLDDIETGLRPVAQRQLVRILRKLAEQDDRLQLIMTTHSPYVLDELEPQQIWMLGRDAQQQVHVRRLSDRPGVDDALRVLTTGELWSVDGEEWIGKGVEATEAAK